MDELQIVYTTEAMQDILGISDYYFDKVGESAALRAVDALQNNIDKLMRFPRMGEEHPDEYLKVLNFCKLAHDNHIVIYRVDTETVIIERIVWASSNYPGTFSARSSNSIKAKRQSEDQRSGVFIFKVSKIGHLNFLL